MQSIFYWWTLFSTEIGANMISLKSTTSSFWIQEERGIKALTLTPAVDDVTLWCDVISVLLTLPPGEEEEISSVS